MFRAAALFALIPTVGLADWAPSPMVFTYEGAFDLCRMDPTDPFAARSCAETLAAAYVLKRAVAEATAQCPAQDLAGCPLPFEDAGLPAIAAQIAVDAHCEDDDIATFDKGQALSPDHCISIISDILFDEGVVPLDTAVSCNAPETECTELAELHATLWTGAVKDQSEDLPTVRVRLGTALADCADTSSSQTLWAKRLEVLECQANSAARLWSDLASETQD